MIDPDVLLITWWVVFLLMGWYPCCCSPPDVDPCDHCITDTTPYSVTVTLGNIINIAGACDDCTELNASYVLTPDPVYSCRWVYEVTYECTSGTSLTLNIQAYLISTGFPNYYKQWNVQVQLHDGDGYGQNWSWVWVSGSSSAIDCSVGRTMIASGNFDGGSMDYCSQVGRTLTCSIAM